MNKTQYDKRKFDVDEYGHLYPKKEPKSTNNGCTKDNKNANVKPIKS